METMVMEEQFTTNSIETTALTTSEQAKAITVQNEADNTRASEVIRTIAALDKQAEEFFRPMKRKMDEAKKEILDKEKSVREPLAEAKRYLSSQIGGYLAREEQKRRDEEARLRAIAEQGAREKARREAEDIALQRASEAAQAGNQEQAEAILSAPLPAVPVFVPPVIIPKTAVAQEGISSRKAWKFRIANPSLVPREYLVPDEKKIGQIVKAMKQETAIPGVEVYAEDGVAVR